jgi:hypothetical protein
VDADYAAVDVGAIDVGKQNPLFRSLAGLQLVDDVG